MCFELGELEVGEHDLLLGELEDCPFYIDERLLERWGQTQLILDVSPGEPEGFSLPAGTDHHFVTRSRVLPRGERSEPAVAGVSVSSPTSSQTREPREPGAEGDSQ